MKVADVMVRDVLTIDSSASLVEAATQMREANVGVLPVMRSDELAGVVTDRDLVVRGLALNLDPFEAKVDDCASYDVRFARPGWDVDQALTEMAQNQIGRLPVLDDQDHLVGMVTLSSLALRGNDGKETLQTAREVSRRSARG
jgi:CBS domain-containing protein